MFATPKRRWPALFFVPLIIQHFGKITPNHAPGLKGDLFPVRRLMPVTERHA